MDEQNEELAIRILPIVKHLKERVTIIPANEVSQMHAFIGMLSAHDCIGAMIAQNRGTIMDGTLLLASVLDVMSVITTAVSVSLEVMMGMGMGDRDYLDTLIGDLCLPESAFAKAILEAMTNVDIQKYIADHLE